MSDRFYHKGTKNTPMMVFDPAANQFEIIGRSFHENPAKAYSGAIGWAEGFQPQEGSEICIIIHFTYLSSTSVIYLLRLLKRFDTIDNNVCTISVKWQYADDDEIILVTGEDLESLVSLKFNFEIV
jgi:hypothetical protein